MDPPFQAEHCMQNRTFSNLLTSNGLSQLELYSTPVLSVQSSYKQSLENLNLQAWCMQQRLEFKCTAQKVGVSTSSGRDPNFFACFARILGECGSSLLEVLDPPL